MNKQNMITGLLLGFLTFNSYSQEQVVYDHSIGHNHGYFGSNENIEESDPGLVNGHIGKALNFDGKDDFMLIPDSDCSNLDISGGPLTISAWVNPDSHSASNKTRSIAGKGNTQYKLGQNKEGWEFSIYDADGFQTVRSLEKPETGKWTHLVGRYDPESDDVSLWVNGKKQNNAGVSGGAESGSFMNLETPVASPHSGETVSVTDDYDAVPDDGQDDTEAIQQALNSGKNVMFPDGVYDISGNLNINNADMADKTIFAENNRMASIRSAKGSSIICHYFYHIKGLAFQKVTLEVYGGDDKNHSRFITDNKFVHPYQDTYTSIKIPKNQKVENLVIKRDSIFGGLYGVLVGNKGTGMLKNSYIENNYTKGCRRHYIFNAGAVNVKIRNNMLQGQDRIVEEHPFTHKDMVGIGFFLFMNNTPVRGNIIENNTLHDIYEEGISFDPFGNWPESYSRWTGSITDWKSSDGHISRMYLSSIPNTPEWNDGNGYQNYHLVIYEDESPLKGKSTKIINAGVESGRAFINVQGCINENMMQKGVHGLILAQIPRNVIIRNNNLERIGRTGINLNAGFNYLIENNTITDCNLQEDTHPTHRLRWGGVTVRSVTGFNNPGKHSPAFYNTVMNNTLSGTSPDSDEYGTDITLYTHNWGGEVFQSFANNHCGNTLLNGAKVIVRDVEDGGPISNFSDVAIGYNAQTRGEYFDGKIDEVKIYRRALSDEEVTKVANGEDIGDTFLFGNWKFDSLLQTLPSAINTPEADNKSVSIYPNPASGSTYLSFEANYKNKQLEIIDMLGAKIKSLQLNEEFSYNDTYQLDISDMKSGLYLLTIKTDQHTIIRKLQVNR